MYFKFEELKSNSNLKKTSPKGIGYKSLVKQLVMDKSCCHSLFGAALAAMVSLGAGAWIAAFLIRAHGLSIAHVGIYLAITIGIVGALGTWLGGVISDHLGSKDPTWRLKFIAVTLLIAKPFAILFYLLDNTTLALVVFIVPALTGAMLIGPTFSHLYSRVEASSRPMVTAIFMFMVNLIGLGLGPILVGLMSDAQFSAYGPNSLRYALVALQIAGFWAAVHFWIAGRAIKFDFVGSVQSKI
ncbi:MFS transporter [Maritalea sp.]|uniref:MFS transporter n=1 Tax=Maritalea sp. TaxID=2003361 RepID=UPI003EF39563